ncbi:hypothetical protein ASD03_31950 [Ensifer sp. Root127]|nr:hypothetical protein ASD03_31950 [Ensifer sp. Root127]
MFGAGPARQLDFASPYPDAASRGELLEVAISTLAISSPIHSVTVLDKPAVDFTAVGAEAHSDEPLVPIPLDEFARPRRR